MQLRKLLLPGLLSVTLLSGCSLFSGEEDVVKMSPCRRLKTSLPHPPRGVSVGNGIGDFYSNLHPAFADSVVYAADRKGTVKAVNADDGKKCGPLTWRKKTAGSPVNLHCCLAA
jgi:outer membrane protein assembly factor BamB